MIPTAAKIRETAVVLDQLSDSDVDVHQSNKRSWRAQAIVLREVADVVEAGRRESVDEPTTKAIPIPSEAMSPEAFGQVTKYVLGYGDDS